MIQCSEQCTMSVHSKGYTLNKHQNKIYKVGKHSSSNVYSRKQSRIVTERFSHEVLYQLCTSKILVCVQLVVQWSLIVSCCILHYCMCMCVYVCVHTIILYGAQSLPSLLYTQRSNEPLRQLTFILYQQYININKIYIF